MPTCGPPKFVDYAVVDHWDQTAFECDVRVHLQNGWLLLGPAQTYAFSGIVHYIQTLYKVGAS